MFAKIQTKHEFCICHFFNSIQSGIPGLGPVRSRVRALLRIQKFEQFWQKMNI